MPGLYSLSSWEALPLKSSRVKACANGYSLSITAHLVYTNPHEEPVEGIFIYPLEESEVVAGFEAVAGSRRVTFQVQNRHRARDCCLQCGPSPSRPRRCASGHFVLDEDTERSTFIIVTGTLCPVESLAITLSTVQELPTLPDGALRLRLPPVLVPRIPAVPEKSVDVFRGRPCNPFPYEFAFELLVKGPCLLAGLESPTHALRADADPWASSAATTRVTLAEPHCYDRDLEIILYPCEPHHPHLVIENGTMTYPEYEAHVRSRRDYARIARKDHNGERQVAFVQKRFHKDIFPNPVLMLNFCPVAEGVPGDLQNVTREVLFLIDCSSTMSGPDLNKVKEALLVALKSLPSGTLLNVAGFGTDVKPLFPSSRLCSNLFLFTDAAAGNTGRILRLLRRQASTVRCFSFGMGPRVCRRLLKAMAKVSRGRAEFLSPAERLQPKLIKSLKKAIEPAISDITIDWYVPDSMEALLSPTELPALYPGDRLISYCVLYSIARFRDRRPPGRDRARRGSRSSALPSREEMPSPGESHPAPRSTPGSRDASLELSTGGTEASERSADPVSGGDIWKRIYQPSYIQEQYVLTHCSVSTDRSQGLLSRSSTSSESTGSHDVAPEAGTKVPVALSTEELARRKKTLARAALASRSFSSPHGELDARRLCRALEKVSQKRNQSLEGQLDQLGSQARRLQPSTVESNNLLSPTHLDWDMLVEPSYLFSASPVPEPGEPCPGTASLPLRCQVVIHALQAGKPVSWEGGKGWDKPLHHLAARSVIQDNENAAQREAELEQGFARRFRLKAMQTSKACNVPSLYTRLVSVDGATQAALPTAPEVWGTAGSASRPQATAAGSWPHRSSSVGLGQQRDREEQDEAPIAADRDETPGSPASISSPTYGWEKPNCSNGPPTSPSIASMGSQKSTESIAGSRFSLGRRRGPSLVLRPQCLSPESECSSNHASHDYLPLVQLQQARGPFQLTESFSEVVQIPLDRLRRASPYASHRASLSPTSPGARSSPEAAPGGEEGEDPPAGPEDLESASWATAVALAWLEHRCAGFFEEWELVAAKADAWLQAQRLPEGLDVGCLKGAARHLFLLLRHWDENIKLNMLCYNPNNV
ncbi:von Willebrand factor A domain-containing protein 5B2 [Patagioenas fasciata monilis]|uniref:von Willebrand factor A domain-containing protein 5B2 n=1 Tax=Patagioenas fasciata monilis TaxID=372326 RepID=A0A1V4K3M6_PATFA|nr:von Willebrand factor A domain-containing protein 5B2 [Patagioenas fasciata monilis]